MVSNGERLAELSEKAANAEDAATLQVLKTMDSIEAKTQQLQTSLQSLYTSTGVQNFFKGILDVGNEVVRTFTRMPTILNLPIPAIAKIGTTFTSLATIVTNVFAIIKARLTQSNKELNLINKVANKEQLNDAEIEAYNELVIQENKYSQLKTKISKGEEEINQIQNEANQERLNQVKEASQRELEIRTQAENELQAKNATRNKGMILSAVGLGISSLAASIDVNKNRKLKGGTTLIGTAAQAAGTYFMMGGGVLGGIMATITGITGLLEGLNILFESSTARAERLKEAATEANNALIQKNAEARDLKDQIKQYQELEKAQYDSEEARKSFLETSNKLAEQFPEIVSGYTSEGDAIIDLTAAYDKLIKAREDAVEAAKNAAAASTDQTEEAVREAEKQREKNRQKALENRYDDTYGSSGLTYGLQASAFLDSFYNLYGKNLNDSEYKNLDIVSNLLNNLKDYDYLGIAQEKLNQDEVKEALDNLRNVEDEEISKIIEFIDSYSQGLIEVDRDITSKRNENENKEKSELYRIIDKSNQEQIDVANREEEQTVLNKLSDVGTIIDNYMLRQFENYKQKIESKEIKYDDKKYKSILDQFDQEQYDNLYETFYEDLNNFWNSLDSTEQNDFTDLLSNRGAYDFGQFGDILFRKFDISGDSELGRALMKYYDDAFDYNKFEAAIQKRGNNGNIEEIIYKYNDALNSLGPNELSKILEIYDNISNQIEKNNISQNIGQNLLDSYLNIWNITKDWDDENREAAQLLLSTSDLTTLAGLNEFKKAVTESLLSKEYQDQLLSAAENFTDLSPRNLVSEYGSLEAKIASNLSDLEKALNNAANGMDSKTALEMAAKLNLSLSDFEFKNGKYFYDDTNKLIEKYGDIDQVLINSINDSYQKTYDMVEKLEINSNSNLFNFPFLRDGNAVSFSELSQEAQLDELQRNFLLDSEQANEILGYYNNYYSEFIKVSEKYDNNFWKYVKEQLIQSKGNVDEILNNVNYIANVNDLKAGNFGAFFNSQNLDQENKFLASTAIKNKDLDTLLQMFPEYSSILIGIFENLSQNIYNNILNGITSDGYIKTDETTDAFYKKYTYGPNAILKQIADYTYKFIGDGYQVIIDDIKADETLTDDQKNNLLKTIHTDQFKDNIYTALSNVIDKYNSFSYEAGQALATALGGDDIDALIEQGIITEDTAGNLSTSYEQMRDYLNSNIQNMSTKQYNDLRAKLEAANYKQSDEAIFANIIKNRESLNELNVADLANMLGYTYSYVANNILNDNGNGTYSIDLTQIQTLINQGRITVTDEMKELMANEIDNVISSITGLVGSQSKGYTNLADMQKFVNNLNKIAGSNYGFQDLFEYSDILHAYQLSTQGIIAQIQIMKGQLSNMTKEQQEVAKQLIADTARQFAEQIDISGYLNLDDTDPAKAIKEQEVMLAIHDYNMAVEAIGEGTVLYTEQIMNSLKEGGLNAVQAARTIADAAGKTLTADEVEAAYRSEVSQLTAAFEQLVYEPGTIIDNAAADILEQANFGIERIEDTNQALITSVGNINEAYIIYLDKLRASGEATLVDLNEATAMTLETNESEKTEVIETLGKAASMTYSEFANILTKAGIELTEGMINQLEEADIIKKLGGGKMQIIDFKSFADLMHWDIDANSEEYVSAFRAYNDALIELNRKTEKTIADEIHSISDAKAGDQINLTQLSVELGETALDALTKKLRSYGADLSEGILTLGNNANIPAIIQEIAQEAANKGLLLEDTMAELADTLNDVLENYASLIDNGIDGKLTNSQAQQLQTQATSLGFKGNLNFSKTADGLKLSEQSAASLYNHLKSVDTIKSRLVLDKLYKSITSSNDKLKTMSSTMVTIDSTQKKIKENEERIARLYNSGMKDRKDRAAQIQKENDKLKDQLNLYKDIRMEQMGDSESYAFMDQDLPDAFKGPQNYWNSVGKAFTAINQAGESGYMEIADFYNFINEATNLVSMSGQSINLWGMQIDGSAETAANLIEKGFGALSNIDGEGVKIDLTRLGVNFSKGADGMADGFTTGIKALAKSQIALIDAEIAMLETFVAMDALGDIDVDKNGIFDFTSKELGTLDEQGEYIERFGTGYKNAIAKVKKYFENNNNNKDIQNAYNNFKINGHSIKELLNASEKQLKDWGIKGKTLQTLLQKFYELSQSDEFSTNPSEIWKQIAESLSDEELAELDFTFNSPEIGKMTIENGNKFGIDFDSATAEAAKDFLKKHGKNKKDLNKALEDAFEKYQTGKSNTVDLTAVLMAKGIVETKSDGIYVNGERFENEDDPGYIEAIAKAALKDVGVTGDIEYDAGTGTATGKYQIGTETVTVTSQNGKILYHSDTLNKSFGSIDDLLKVEYNARDDVEKDLTFEEWKNVHYNTKLDINATVEEGNTNETDLKNNIWKILNGPKDIVEQAVIDANAKENNVNADGTITIDVQGTKVKISNIGNVEQQTEAAYNALKNTVDPDGMIEKISTAITNAFQNLNIAQLFIDGLTSSLQVQSENGTIQFTSNPTITALGANLGQGIAAGIASASGTGISNFFKDNTKITTITDPIKTGLANSAKSATVTDNQYDIPYATATLKKMEINQVDEAGFSSSTLGSLMKAVRAIAGGSSSDLTLNSATAAIKKLSIVSVGQTDLQNQIQAEINAKVGTVDITNLTNAKQEIINTITSVTNTLTTLKNRIADLNTNSSNANASVGSLKTTLMGVANSQGPARAENFKNSLNNISQNGPERAENFKKSLNNLGNYGPQRANNFVSALNNLGNWGSSYASAFVKAVNNLKDHSGRAWGFVNAVNAMRSGKIKVSVMINGPAAYSWSVSWAKGNIALSKGTQNQALAGGSKKTLVGELGPELVVSNGHYYVVGQDGAEMVNLPDDAIVFNHIQTKKLLGNGKGGRGKPVTNEKNAVSYATGNVGGPAMASASSVLAALKELRAMWESMLTASAKQLGSQAGKSKDKTKTGSSKGDNGDGTTTTADDGTRIKTTTAEIQRWYNLLRQIDKTEKDITYQEKLQTQYQSLRVADGKSLYKSYKTELSMLEDQIDRSKELAELQKSWYDTKRAELAASAYGKIFTYTEDGLQQYVDGANKGLDILEKLTEADIWGNPTGYAKTAATQLNYIQSLGFDLSELLSNSDGTKVAGRFVGINTIYDEDGKLLEGQDLINAQVSIMENFWDNIDGWRDELDGLYDSYREQLSNVVDNQNKQNEIMQKIVDNQIEVENKVYDALVDARQAIIDNAQKEMDAYQKNSDEMIDSLNKTLDKERQLYDNQKNSNDLLKLQRQLAILQRSGGSTSQILSLQQQIATKQQDMYFDEKEEQIKALQEASDLQLEKMQEQVDLMSETLEYQKENGLLWKEVYAVMQRTPEDIIGFITNNAADWGSQSAIQISQNIADLQTKIQLYTSSRDDDFISYYNDISSNLNNILSAINTQNGTNNVVGSSTNNSSFSTSSGKVTNNTSTNNTNNTGKEESNKYIGEGTITNMSLELFNNPSLSNSGVGRYSAGPNGFARFKIIDFLTSSNGYPLAQIDEVYDENGNRLTKFDKKYMLYNISDEVNKYQKIIKYKQGGLIDFTGPAWVDGTSSQPEAILNANETKFIQNKLPNILNSVDTLQERLKDLQTLRADWLSSISHVVDNSNNQNSSVNIEHVELNMNVEQMSSSADAKKLGREAFDELLNMARKAGKNSVSRR